MRALDLQCIEDRHHIVAQQIEAVGTGRNDAAAMAAMREADADIAAGRLYSADEVESELRAKGIVT